VFEIGPGEGDFLQGDQTSVLLRPTLFSHLRLLFDLFKLRIGLVIGFTAIAGLAITPGRSLAAWQVCALALAVTMASAAAGAFNQIAERDLDAGMRRTRDRAFVTGRLTAGPAWFAAIAATGAAGVGLAAIALNAATALYTFLGAFTYAIVYTIWLKRRTWWNIVIGGLAGSFAVLAGAAAVSPNGLEPLPLAFAIVLFLWTPPHFWSLAIAYHDDYAAAKVPMLPVVVGDARAARAVFAGAALLVAASLVPALLGMGRLYLTTAIGAGVYLLVKSAQLARAPNRRAAIANFHASLAYLALLLSAAILDATLKV
jgi:protoheme IX farnesyltransferase